MPADEVEMNVNSAASSSSADASSAHFFVVKMPGEFAASDRKVGLSAADGRELNFSRQIGGIGRGTLCRADFSVDRSVRCLFFCLVAFAALSGQKSDDK
ncbi:hypothetical protein niasHS_015087 [Heterodera schachtii]|uniref:Uncharacterized protein n=1 Tax=Heterodera schachtii TaxID=97005 RepID=A0ABD2I233_HETSC